MELSSLIGKRIVSPVGEALGYVMRACPTRDLKKLSSLVCVDGEEEEYYLPARAVTAVSDAVVAGKARLNAPTGIYFPVGMPAYSEHGELLGIVSDFLLGEAPAIVISKIIITNDGARAVYPAECVQIGDTVIVYSTPVKRASSAKKARSSHRKKALLAQAASPAEQPNSNSPASMEAMSGNSDKETLTPAQANAEQPVIEPTVQEEKTAETAFVPPMSAMQTQNPLQREKGAEGAGTGDFASSEGGMSEMTAYISAPSEGSMSEMGERQGAAGVYSINRLNLLGRRVKKSLFDGNGVPIVRAGERITADILSAARKENKLLQLTVNTLTNLV